jgi:hypothetical protein
MPKNGGTSGKNRAKKTGLVKAASKIVPNEYSTNMLKNK